MGQRFICDGFDPFSEEFRGSVKDFFKSLRIF